MKNDFTSASLKQIISNMSHVADILSKTFKKLSENYQLDDDLVEMLTELLTEQLSKYKLTKIKKKSSKKGQKGNYYSYFHSFCRAKRDNDMGPLASEDILFSFHEENLKLISTDKSRDNISSIIEQLTEEGLMHNLLDLNYHSLVELVEMFDQIEKESEALKEWTPMNITSLIWWMFLTEEHRNQFKEWYKTTINVPDPQPQ
jgi:hypothetical protein